MSACDRAGCWSSVTYPVQLRDPNGGAPYFGRLCRRHHDEAEAAGHLVPRTTLPTSGRAPGIVHDRPVPRPTPEPTMPPKIPDAVRLKARALRAEGVSHRDIAHQLGIAQSTAFRLTLDVQPEGAKPSKRKSVARKTPPADEVRQDAQVGTGAETTSAPVVETPEPEVCATVAVVGGVRRGCCRPAGHVGAHRDTNEADTAWWDEDADPVPGVVAPQPAAAPHPLAPALALLDAEVAQIEAKLDALREERVKLVQRQDEIDRESTAALVEAAGVAKARATLARLAGLAA